MSVFLISSGILYWGTKQISVYQHSNQNSRCDVVRLDCASIFRGRDMCVYLTQSTDKIALSCSDRSWVHTVAYLSWLSICCTGKCLSSLFYLFWKLIGKWNIGVPHRRMGEGAANPMTMELSIDLLMTFLCSVVDLQLVGNNRVNCYLQSDEAEDC